MELCPNLITLKWSGSPLYTRNEKQYDTLRILQLDVREDEYHDLLAKLPGLVVLSINIGLSIYSLCRVSRYCSSLKCIKYYTHPYDAIRWPYEYDQSLEPGIQELYFGDGYYGDLTENINENLIRAAKTLKYLEVQHSLYEEEPVMIPLPSDTMFPHLIHLSGAPESDDVLRLLLSIIPRAPSLEVIRLGHPFILWEDSAPINTMASLVHLTDTNVIMEENYQEIDVLKRFLTIHIQKGSYSQLRSLAIGIWTEECAQELLPLLLQLPLLEKLHIAVDYDTPLPTILDAIATKNAMKQLKLSVIICDTIDEPIFGRLQHAPSLTSLIIDVHHLSTMAALSLLDLTRLVHLQIPFEGLEDMTIDILRKQFPNMIPLESPSMF